MYLEALLLLLLIGHVILIYGCYDMRNRGHEKEGEWGFKWTAITELLEELLDAIDSIGDSASNGIQMPTGGGLQDFLTQMVMNRVAEGLQHGTENDQGSESSEG